MAELRNALKRLITIMSYQFNPNMTFKFTNIDIKDSFWRMLVDQNYSWNFCYTIPPPSPSTPLEDIQIVVPSSLQMGWCEYPSFFCATAENVQDIIHNLIHSCLELHPLEHKMLPMTYATQDSSSHLISSKLFICACNDLTESNL